MTDPSLSIKKRKITIIASPKGVEIAKKALVRLGFDSKSNFAKSRLLARTTVTKFFQCEPIQLDSFKKICKELKLNWQETAGIIEERQPEQLPTSSYSSPDSDGVREQVQPEHRQVTVIDKQSKKIKAVITLEGDIDSVQNWKIIQSAIREYSGYTIEITDIKEGSIRLFVEGSQEDIERLISIINSGELTTISGFPVQDIQVLSESLEDDESNKLDEKWRLVKKIVSQPVKGRKLSDADLSDANLSSANLSDADLSDADLSDADLSDANLSSANLSSANLSDADLNRANLNRANLNRADLSGANLRNANLSDADLSDADLSSANLFCANLSDADLSSADLSGANLIFADLRNADLRNADLRNADLRNADLRNADLRNADLRNADLFCANLFCANLSSATVINALFGESLGLTKDMKHHLEQRGAIFGDRPPVFAPR